MPVRRKDGLWVLESHQLLLSFKEDIMLVLTRKAGESIIIDGDIVIKVSQVQGNRVKLCIDAPKSHRIVRSELDADDAPKALPRFAARTESDLRAVPAHAK